MKINGFQKLTLLDYPEHIACTIFTSGCNFRCPYCHNAPLVLPNLQSELPIFSLEDILSTLKKRIGILEGVCITGGEPTLHKDLPDFIKQIQSLGFKIKLDTNGSNPKMLHNLIEHNLVNYVAMDIKNSKDRYSETIGIPHYDIGPIVESVDILRQNLIPYEFRTTVVREYHDALSMEHIGEWLQSSPAYYLQQFKDSGNLIDTNCHMHSKEQMQEFVQILKKYITHTYLRGTT